MYVVIAFAVALVVIALAWRGFGVSNPGEDRRSLDYDRQQQPRPQKPRPAQTRPVAPDDDPDFLREIDRKLRGEDKSN